jgi:NADP-reducing hydrogenase subunit HndB
MKIKSLNDLKSLKDELKSEAKSRDKLIVKVSMSTCGIASGAKETMDYMINELDNKAIDADVIKTGCMGYCYAEPTIEISSFGKEPVIFGYVDTKRAQEVIDKYIIAGELVEGVIPLNFEKA